ncbi:MAG: hypothetical protein HY067_08940 [Betaproteobacteria bacterium]|nr:hypothetical protein [Betaproteobacteria bacterium]
MIDLQQFSALCGFSKVENLQRAHRQWIEQALAEETAAKKRLRKSGGPLTQGRLACTNSGAHNAASSRTGRTRGLCRRGVSPGSSTVSSVARARVLGAVWAIGLVRPYLSRGIDATHPRLDSIALHGHSRCLQPKGEINARMRALRRDRFFVARVPGLFLAIVIAEFLYKFHSFALESFAFLAIWLVIDILCDRLFGKRSSASTKHRFRFLSRSSVCWRRRSGYERVCFSTAFNAGGRLFLRWLR